MDSGELSEWLGGSPVRGVPCGLLHGRVGALEGLAQYEGLAVTISSLDECFVRPIPLTRNHELICLCLYHDIYEMLHLSSRFI